MTYEQKNKIFELIKRCLIQIIKDKFSLSESTIKQIFRMFEDSTQRLKWYSYKFGAKIFKSKRVRNEIVDLIINHENPFASNLYAFCWKRNWIRYSSMNDDKVYEKWTFNLIQKPSSRPIQIDVKRMQCLKTLFSVIVAKQLDKSKWVVNVDESLFSRSQKQNYIWLLKGVSGSAITLSRWIYNPYHREQTTGASYSSMANNTIDSD